MAYSLRDDRALCDVCGGVIETGGIYLADLGLFAHLGPCRARVHAIDTDYGRSARGRRRPPGAVRRDVAMVLDAAGGYRETPTPSSPGAKALAKYRTTQDARRSEAVVASVATSGGS